MVSKQSRSEIRVKKHVRLRNRFFWHSRETAFSSV